MKFNFIMSTVKSSTKYYCFIVIILLSISCNKTESYENLNLLVENEWNLFLREKNNINIIGNCDLDDKLFFENSATFNYDFGVLIEYWKIIEINDSLLILADALAEDNGQNPEIRIYKN